jgi:hypothetical protein
MMRRGAAVALLVLTALAGAAGLYSFDPSAASFYPPCPFRALTGLHCPGCGTLRAFHALLHGDIPGALKMNPVTTLGAPLLLVGALRESWRVLRGTDPIPVRAPAWSIRALLILLVGFAVLRNLPAFAWLAPA